MATDKTPKLYFKTLHQGQKYVIAHSKKRNMIVAGRKWRKTTLAALIAAEAALKGKIVFWAAPTKDQTRIGLQECVSIVQDVAKFNMTEGTLKFNIGGDGHQTGKIIFRSMDDPETSRGHNCDVLVVDEGQDISELAYTEVLSKLMLAAEGGGETWIIGTPKQVGTYFHELYLNYQSREDCMVFNCATLGCKIIKDEDGKITVVKTMNKPKVKKTLKERLKEKKIESDDSKKEKKIQENK